MTMGGWSIKKQQAECKKQYIHKDVIYDRWRKDSEFQTLVTNSLNNLNRGMYYGKKRMKPPSNIKQNTGRIFVENVPGIGAVELPTSQLTLLVISGCIGISIIVVVAHYCGVF